MGCCLLRSYQEFGLLEEVAAAAAIAVVVVVQFYDHGPFLDWVSLYQAENKINYSRFLVCTIRQRTKKKELKKN